MCFSLLLPFVVSELWKHLLLFLEVLAAEQSTTVEEHLRLLESNFVAATSAAKTIRNELILTDSTGHGCYSFVKVVELRVRAAPS